MGHGSIEAADGAVRQQTSSMLDTDGDSSPGSDPAKAKQQGSPDEPQVQAWPWEAKQESASFHAFSFTVA